MASIISAGTTVGTAINISGDTSGSLVLASNNGTTAVTIATNQNVTFANNATFPTTIGVGGATPSASGSGITFPATQSASTDANTLDDYEEGTFTVTAFGQSTAGTTTYSNQQGSYTKIGRQVTISIRLTYSALTGTGELRVGNFPFTVSNDSMEYIAPLITSNLNWGGGSYIQVYVIPNTTQAVFFHCSDDAGWGVQQCVNESAEIRFTATYFV
jgi:hypothetical protein